MTSDDEPTGEGDAIRLDRVYDATPQHIWELWTTAAGIEAWWAPDGFENEVHTLELRPGGALVYVMTATAPGQVEFMQRAGMPLATEVRKTFTEVVPTSRLAYTSLIDFVPDVAPYEHLTTVDIASEGGGARVVMTMEPLHDDVWTERIVAGRGNELDNLERLLAEGGGDT
jgi:uncharacterized protein YndB with AHSA1/START domain